MPKSKSKSKRQKLSSENNNKNDRISDLPECLLIHILSFLPTQTAMATSILSKRWKHVWTHVPVLDVESENLDSVQSVFDQHKAPYLQCCSLTYKFCSCCYRLVLRWINNLASRKVEQLDLEMHTDGHKSHKSCLELPHRVFSCSTLVFLSLRGVRIDPPSSFQLPCLKKLDLYQVFYESDPFVRLLSGCPVLEDLSFDRDFSDKDSEVHYLVEINAPALEYFSFDGHLSDFVFLEKLDNLVRAEVNICTFEPKDHEEEECYVDRVFKLLAALYNVKFLSFFTGHSECLSNGSTYPSQFQNLLRLDFKVNTWNWHVLQDLLKNSPNLEVLDVTNMSTGPTGSLLGWKKSPNDPLFLSSHLTTFYLREVKGLEHEMEFVKYILKEAGVLKSAKIRVGNIKLKEIVREKLSKIPRRSMTCLLTVK
ncbi:F-box/LRR-repeat protein At3g26922-like [Castanea sativa]|uniref:F-box/LRR-repeat protein At3g26922-like n=1 Tax=Castanea sativa TaxID=21020 RepID=UPI003F64F047